VKLGIAVAAFALAALAAVMVLVLRKERDTTPNTVRDCAERAGARFVPGIPELGPLRVDLLAGTLQPAGQVRLKGGNWATFVQPADRSYLVAVVTDAYRSKRRVLRLLRTQPSIASTVAWAGRGDGAAALRGCVEAQRV
jgi:hypothetical protein